MNKRRISVDVAVIGGGVGGCAAALAALEAGCRVVLSEETAWIGGQLTSQLVPPDEHGWIEKFGRTESYHRFRQMVRSHYRNNYPLSEAARRDPQLNPGNGWVSPLCHEPKVALAVLESLLRPHQASGRLLLLPKHGLREVQLTSPEVIGSVTLECRRTAVASEIAAAFFVDATEFGDLIALSGTELVTGQESSAQTGEPGAPAVARPDNVQAFSWCFAMDYHAGENHVGPPPESYVHWRQYCPPLCPPWPDVWLSWSGLNPRTMQPAKYHFSPHGERMESMNGLWTYRRILDREQFVPGAFSSDVVVVNWPMIDYLAGSLLSLSPAERESAREEARQLSRSALYWMQTEAPRPDGGAGWPGLRMRGDIAGTDDGLAMAPYVRESRRILAEQTVREQHVSARLRAGNSHAEPFHDSVGVGYYRIDLHPSTGGDNFHDVATLPFQIPLGALLPVRMENLLPAAKNIGTTHITNGCYRLHPVEWNIGESAGALAAFCLQHDCRPRSVRRDLSLLHSYQQWLQQRGIPLDWPDKLNVEDGDPHIHARMTPQPP